MEQRMTTPPAVDPSVSEEFYHFVGQVPATEAAWAERQARLRSWRSDPHFEPYWRAMDHLLTDDYSSFKRRTAALVELAGDLEGDDFDAWREGRDYDLKDTHDRLPCSDQVIRSQENA